MNAPYFLDYRKTFDNNFGLFMEGDLTKNLLHTTWTYKIAEFNQIDSSNKQHKKWVDFTI